MHVELAVESLQRGPVCECSRPAPSALHCIGGSLVMLVVLFSEVSLQIRRGRVSSGPSGRAPESASQMDIVPELARTGEEILKCHLIPFGWVP
jgi:hypothetical protein